MPAFVMGYLEDDACFYDGALRLPKFDSAARGSHVSIANARTVCGRFTAAGYFLPRAPPARLDGAHAAGPL